MAETAQAQTQVEAEDYELVASANVPNTRQRMFIRYFTAILIDLVVLGLFAEFWDRVMIDSFSITLLAAILLQVLLRLTLAIEHRVAAYFNAKGTKTATVMRFLAAWFILFSSKFVMLGAINFLFGDAVLFGGAAHGIVAFLVVVFAMLLSEEAIARLVRALG